MCNSSLFAILIIFLKSLTIFLIVGFFYSFIIQWLLSFNATMTIHINNEIIILSLFLLERNGDDSGTPCLCICILLILSCEVQLVNTCVQLYIDGVTATVDWGQANWTHCQPHRWLAPSPRGCELIIVIFLPSTVVSNTLIGSIPSNTIRRDGVFLTRFIIVIN